MNLRLHQSIRVNDLVENNKLIVHLNPNLTYDFYCDDPRYFCFLSGPSYNVSFAVVSIHRSMGIIRVSQNFVFIVLDMCITRSVSTLALKLEWDVSFASTLSISVVMKESLPPLPE